MPKLLGLSQRDRKETFPSNVSSHPSVTDAGGLSRTRVGSPSKESLGSFRNRAGFSSKESLGSFRDRAAFSSKDYNEQITRRAWLEFEDVFQYTFIFDGGQAGAKEKCMLIYVYSPELNCGVHAPQQESVGAFRNRGLSSTKESVRSAGAQSATSSHRSRSRDGGSDAGSQKTTSKERPAYGSRRKASKRRDRGSVVRTKSSTGSGGGGGFRRGTNRSSRSGGSRLSVGDANMDEEDSEESSDSEGLEDLDMVPPSLTAAIPLHMREAIILKKKGEKVEEVSKALTDNVPEQPEKSKLAESEPEKARADEQGPAPPADLAPSEDVYCAPGWVYAQVISFGLWVLAAVGLLGLHLWRLQGEIAESTHRLVADTALRTLEVNASGLLSPALSVARAVSLGAKSGFFDVEDPYTALGAAVAPELQLAPSIRHVQVLGMDPERMVRVLPGRIHDPLVAPEDRNPLIYALSTSDCRDSADVMACFALNTSNVELRPARTEGADLAWIGPSFLRTGSQGEILDPASWDSAHHLLAMINISTAAVPARPSLYADVAVELAPLLAAARAAAPSGGAILIATREGWLLTASSAEAVAGPVFAPVDDASTAVAAEDGVGDVIAGYQSVWDLPEAWVAQLTPEMLHGKARSEFWVGQSLGVVRPLSLGSRGPGYDFASAETLRVAVLTPSAEAVRPLLVQISYAAMAVLVSPFVAAALLCVGLTLLKICRCVCKNVVV